MFQYFGEDKATALIKDIVTAIQPITTDGHLAQARSVGSGEFWLSLNNFVNLTMNVKLAAGRSTISARSGGADVWRRRHQRQGAASERRALGG